MSEIHGKRIIPYEGARAKGVKVMKLEHANYHTSQKNGAKRYEYLAIRLKSCAHLKHKTDYKVGIIVPGANYMFTLCTF